MCNTDEQILSSRETHYVRKLMVIVAPSGLVAHLHPLATISFLVSFGGEALAVPAKGSNEVRSSMKTSVRSSDPPFFLTQTRHNPGYLVWACSFEFLGLFWIHSFGLKCHEKTQFLVQTSGWWWIMFSYLPTPKNPNELFCSFGYVLPFCFITFVYFYF